MRRLSSLSIITRWLDRLQPSESTVLAGAAIVVGLTSAIGVWLFKRLIDLFHSLAFDALGGTLARVGPWMVFIVPVVGGLVVGLILHFFIGEERHHGVAGIMEAVALAGGRLPFQRMPAKAIAAAVSIGAGASVGPEDPSVQIGANLGSMVGQIAHLSDDRLRTLVAAGVAGGIAAAFNAPIAGVFFALEIVLGELSAGTLFHGLAVPRWVKPMIAGLIVGLIGLFLPQLFGVGYETIGEILNGAAPALSLVLALLIGKLILTPLCIGAGFPGGVFAPSLFIGAMVGNAFGQVIAAAFPQIGITPAAFAMVGMAAVLAGAVHTPLTAIILLFEMTNDYRIILPVMFAVTVSLVIAWRFQRDSVYTLALARKGVRLERGRDVELLESIRVDEVMEQSPSTLVETAALSDATDWLMHTRHHGVAVMDANNRLSGILTLQDIERARHVDGTMPADLTVGDVYTHDVLTAFPDESIGTAMRRMSTRDIGRLPVVARMDVRRLLGVLRRADMVRAYDVALTRRAETRHRSQQVRLGAYSGARVQEISIQHGALCADKRVSETTWPQDCVIASIRRGRDIIVPRGDTMLQAGDVLVVVAKDDATETLRELCGY